MYTNSAGRGETDSFSVRIGYLFLTRASKRYSYFVLVKWRLSIRKSSNKIVQKRLSTPAPGRQDNQANRRINQERAPGRIGHQLNTGVRHLQLLPTLSSTNIYLCVVVRQCHTECRVVCNRMLFAGIAAAESQRVRPAPDPPRRLVVVSCQRQVVESRPLL